MDIKTTIKAQEKAKGGWAPPGQDAEQQPATRGDHTRSKSLPQIIKPPHKNKPLSESKQIPHKGSNRYPYPIAYQRGKQSTTGMPQLQNLGPEIAKSWFLLHAPRNRSTEASSIGCQQLHLSCTYIGLPIGANMSRCSNWSPLVERFQKRLSNWKSLRSVSSPSYKGGPWHHIIKLKEDLHPYGLNLELVFKRRVVNGQATRFLLDPWIGGPLLCDSFPRLFRLKSNSECMVIDRAPKPTAIVSPLYHLLLLLVCCLWYLVISHSPSTSHVPHLSFFLGMV
ncbi:reverse transcriptase domain, Zinc finger, CCHC-type, Isoprenoid synthase domain protein [Artemisia annua]|uniref:Reverse transcriptase domain, Zinc finger, CCHC-type, Isoprenoid synthase domain protein n=1 Tax=Artemisia annua TaxID=35608 RepID=A0A2U1KZ81_ARTAN|nr:reverse transcriptase domain, Zinc finger, CCHC-type, Isoprenoid synthase domain protein [Artemisia annua]